MKLRVKFNNTSRTTGGNESAYGALVDHLDNVIPNTNVTISGPKTAGLQKEIDPDKIYIVDIAEAPVTKTA